MVTFNSLRKTVYSSILRQSFNDTSSDADNINRINRIIAGALLYKAIQTILKFKTDSQDSISEISNSYAGTYKNAAEELQKKFITYKYMRRLVESFKLDSFLDIKPEQIEQIYTLYENKKEKVVFSTIRYSQAMYNVMNLTENNNRRLTTVHQKIVVPLITYYKDYFGVKDKDVNVDDVSEGYIAGKVLLIAINGISNRQIISDIDRNQAGVKQYIYSYTITKDDFVKIVLK